MYNKGLKEKIKIDLQHHLSGHRYAHILGVAAAARKLAQQYGYDADKAEVAGLLHDVAKQLPLQDMQSLARRSFGDTLPDAIMSIGSLLHGYAAVTIAKETYGLTDTELLDSLAHHTTGAVHMGLLEKIIFIADYIEVNRDFDGVEQLRMLAASDLDEAVLAGYDSTISHLLEQKKTIFVGTIVNRNGQIEYMASLQGKA
ncbi:MAG: bis(5'-nucleosyl)-tetraphosphatase (symmetrical) YqeK [Megasphaera sp.]|jgi:predicted HD superfamily hydrolase involved in NAD metabolism|nr:bis(5'-nucleosyl)-tetraphosphatase (symmetrical) YqeK [Megasphaera sp.]MCH4188241.1 bis(5'-nucleosyl)-tetraphosphatase (symmetrical) YqeK [Megasphaera sp.]MCH4217301.1 bis(5'-nucleosyl)-tetraphosphatase (symmetrical) YqeK [Megasphaera sp.]